MSYFQNEQAVTQVMRANAPTDGAYFGARGIFASVALLPDLGDKTKDITPNLVRQFLPDTFAALLLVVFLAHLPGSVLSRARWAALAGIVAIVLKMVPYWNCYGFPRAFIGMETLDLVGKFFPAGLVLGALMKKLAPAAAPA